MLAFGLFLAFAAIHARAAPDVYTFRCKGTPQGEEKALDNNLLPINFTAVIRHTDYDAKTTALLEETFLSYQRWLKKTTQSGVRSVGVGKFNVTFNETKCTGFSDPSVIEPLYVIHSLASKALNFHGLSITQLMEGIQQRNFTHKMLTEDIVNVGGIEGVKWVGCDNVTENDIALQVEVTFSGSKSLNPYAHSMRNPLLLSVHVLLFNATATNETVILSHASFDVVELDAPSGIQNKMPQGLFCSGMPKESFPEMFPSKFDASFSLSQATGKRNQDFMVHYDAEERLASFVVDLNKDEEAPFLGNLSDVKDHRRVRLLHDFTYGLEYVVDDGEDTCVFLRGISRSLGDVFVVNETTAEIDLKDPKDLFLNLTQSSLYYAGKRIELDGTLVDVYVSESSSTSGSRVVELFYLDEGGDAVKAGVLHSITQYDKNATGAEVGRTIIHLTSFHNLSASVVPTQFSVQSCLQFPAGSALYATIKAKLPDLTKFGLARVKYAVRRAIASAANVSVLRISDVFFKKSQDDVLALFSISDASGQTPTKTRSMKNESRFEDAVRALNETLSKNDLEVKVPGGKESLHLSQSSLRVIPENWNPSPEPTHAGYSGGSMAVLAIFMLLLGAAIGVGVVLFLWKRQRISSLAYQVFE